MKALALAVALGAPAIAIAEADPTPAPPAAATLAIDPGEDAAIAERLRGQRFARLPGAIRIDDAGGDGPPWIGTVARRDRDLWLVGDGFALRLTGPLARARLAGPGYAIWVTGAITGDAIAAHRLGVLRRPRADRR
ncbi:MAG: hypothetical protein K8W52_31910 [Deltaproteobacteria bacterium]|nr:hypothetical protein [Deltaproteobacteria bacterium]